MVESGHPFVKIGGGTIGVILPWGCTLWLHSYSLQLQLLPKLIGFGISNVTVPRFFLQTSLVNVKMACRLNVCTLKFSSEKFSSVHDKITKYNISLVNFNNVHPIHFIAINFCMKINCVVYSILFKICLFYFDFQ